MTQNNEQLTSEQNTHIDASTSIRVNVGLLDTLMTLAGELVLSRNQLLQGFNTTNEEATKLSCQRIDLITSELQEAIMKTRMQPIDNILAKIRRQVREQSKRAGKSIKLIIEGKDVELDKTILESINEPLKQIVKQTIEEGIESPSKREGIGKDPVANITIRTFHDAGQVNIIISDDGKGFDPIEISKLAISKGLMSENEVKTMSDKEKLKLLFLPGFSQNKNVDASLNDKGMNSVASSIKSLGGVIEIDSTLNQGTIIQIKLPLTLAIIPSQITSVGNERYALPQVNLDELLRIPAHQIKDKIEKVGNADVVRLRGELLPLLDLSKLLGIEKTYIDTDNLEQSDRRKQIADRRSKKHLIGPDGLLNENTKPESWECHRKTGDRRYHTSSALNIAVVSAGIYKYGLIVDQLHDSEEIVVKPVGRHLKEYTAYAGAAIMGDGKVALILDIANLAQMANLSSKSDTAELTKIVDNGIDAKKDKTALITFRNTEDEHFSAFLNTVDRIERIKSSDIEQIGKSKVVQYRGGALELFELSQVTDAKPLPQKTLQEVIVFKIKNKEIGLMVTAPVDTLEISLNIDENTLKGPSIKGSLIINGNTNLLLDENQMIKDLNQINSDRKYN